MLICVARQASSSAVVEAKENAPAGLAAGLAGALGRLPPTVLVLIVVATIVAWSRTGRKLNSRPQGRLPRHRARAAACASRARTSGVRR